MTDSSAPSSERLGGETDDQELHDTWTFRIYMFMAVFGMSALAADTIVGLPPLAWDVISVIVGVFVVGAAVSTICIMADALYGVFG